MNSTNDERAEFIDALSWMGAPPYPMLFYVVCDEATEELVEDIRSFWPNDAEIEFFRLGDAWPFEVALLEIGLSELLDDLDARVCNTLETVARNMTTVTCFMFEGGFGDYQQLFDPEQRRSTYGICVENSPAIVCTKDMDRKLQNLVDELAKAKAWLTTKYSGDNL